MAFYDTIQPLDFLVDSEIGKEIEVFSLSVPRGWIDRFKALLPRDRRIYPPVETLAQAVRFLMPGVMYIEEWWRVPTGSPWLISRHPMDSDLLVLIFRAWLENGFEKLVAPARQNDLQYVAENLDPNDLAWNPELIDLTRVLTHPNGTANPSGTYFNAAPGILVELLSRPGVVIEVNDRGMYFRESYNSRQPELVSWPPQTYVNRDISWFWSYVLKPVAHTMPHLSYPVLRFSPSIRRWVSRSLARPRAGDANSEFFALPPNRNTTVYVAADSPWINAGSAPKRMIGTPIGLEWRDSEHTGELVPFPTWKSQIAPILKNIPMSLQLPEPEKIVREPSEFLKDAVNPSGIVFGSAFRRSHHRVKVGVPAQDRLDLYTGLARVLATQGIVQAPKWARIRTANGRRSYLTEPAKNVPAKVVCSLVQSRIGNRIRFEVFFQSLETGKKLRARIGQIFGLVLDDNAAEGTTEYQSYGLSVEIRLEHAGEIASVLTNSEGGRIKSRAERQAAERRRSEYVANEVGVAEKPTATLIELDNLSGALNDPKDAIRWGLAKADRVSQFITPDGSKDQLGEEEEKDSSEHKIVSSIADVLRQWGLLPGSPLESLPKSTRIPSNLQILGFWIVNLERRDGDRSVLPVAVKIDEFGKVLVKIHEDADWMSYPEMLTMLARSQMDLGRRRESLRQFLRSALAECSRAGPTLLLCQSQNVRRIWEWTSDKNILKDRLSWGKSLSLGEFDGLRVVRVRDDGGASETPPWFAQKEDGSVGIASGIFRGTDDRTVFSLQAKPLSMYAPGGESKTLRPNRQHSMPAIKELFLAVLQPDDRVEEWAALVHRLRKMAFHHDEAFDLPLPLHLASKIEEYMGRRKNN